MASSIRLDNSIFLKAIGEEPSRLANRIRLCLVDALHHFGCFLPEEFQPKLFMFGHTITFIFRSLLASVLSFEQICPHLFRKREKPDLTYEFIFVYSINYRVAARQILNGGNTLGTLETNIQELNS